MNEPAPTHVPVLAEAVVEFLGGLGPGVLVDCTVGLGGHAKLLLEENPCLKLIGLDVDEGNLALARERLAGYGGQSQEPLAQRAGLSQAGFPAGGHAHNRVRLVQANFAELPSVLAELGEGRVGGILADLGASSNQLADPGRGLSFEVDGPLDMRLDRRLRTTAADLLNGLPEGELADLLYLQSQERHSRRIARRICQVRRQGRLNSTVMLARLVASAVGEGSFSRRGRIHPATRTFMALRMSVNRETASLRRLLEQVSGCLRVGGRVAVISFHSVEDRAVKEDFRARSRGGEYRLLTKKPIVAGDREREDNPRSRSAKMRVAELQKNP